MENPSLELEISVAELAEKIKKEGEERGSFSEGGVTSQILEHLIHNPQVFNANVKLHRCYLEKGSGITVEVPEDNMSTHQTYRGVDTKDAGFLLCPERSFLGPLNLKEEKEMPAIRYISFSVKDGNGKELPLLFREPDVGLFEKYRDGLAGTVFRFVSERERRKDILNTMTQQVTKQAQEPDRTPNPQAVSTSYSKSS
jgi:hypothetical protein